MIQAAPKFGPEDAQYLIRLAESAPLANMREAAHAQGVLQRAVGHFNGVFNPPPAADAQDAAREACKTHDPTDLPAAGSPLIAPAPVVPVGTGT